MTDEGYERCCPRCDNRFVASTDRGICPACQLFSRIARDGTPIGLVRTYDSIELQDWPYGPVDEQFGLVLHAFADGGGPLFVADRYDGYPLLSVVHQQLADRFASLTEALRGFVPTCELHTSPDDLVSLSSVYSNATRLVSLRWYEGDSQRDLVGSWTNDGGSVDALLDLDAFWHPALA
ncbi:hypothetical protein [Roseiconus lacunae]|uniref:hypothetical protein n=1 Tax=Roseiconus lacunae TaxID=2605694 RepID=UPI00135CBD8B|nr:hypothetical protein [Roseiconus lacunae]